MAAQVIGFLSNDGNGNYGVEGYFNNLLKGSAGQLVSRKDIKGRVIDPISLNQNDITGQGANIYTTIDRNVQRKVEKYLEEGVKEFGANRGTVVVMNPHTGDVIAMANYPTFDPNNP